VCGWVGVGGWGGSVIATWAAVCEEAIVGRCG